MFNDHFREFVRLLGARGVEFLVVGGYAVGVHGFPRYTGDLDIFVAVNPENADRLTMVFADFGFSSLGLSAKDFIEPDIVIEIGREPMKIQVLTGIDGVSFERARAGRHLLEIDGLTVPFIGYDALVANKAASGRPKDRIDLEELARLRAAQQEGKGQ